MDAGGRRRLRGDPRRRRAGGGPQPGARPGGDRPRGSGRRAARSRRRRAPDPGGPAARRARPSTTSPCPSMVERPAVGDRPGRALAAAAWRRRSPRPAGSWLARSPPWPSPWSRAGRGARGPAHHPAGPAARRRRHRRRRRRPATSASSRRRRTRSAGSPWPSTTWSAQLRRQRAELEAAHGELRAAVRRVVGPQELHRPRPGLADERDRDPRPRGPGGDPQPRRRGLDRVPGRRSVRGRLATEAFAAPPRARDLLLETLTTRRGHGASSYLARHGTARPPVEVSTTTPHRRRRAGPRRHRRAPRPDERCASWRSSSGGPTGWPRSAPWRPGWLTRSRTP